MKKVKEYFRIIPFCPKCERITTQYKKNPVAFICEHCDIIYLTPTMELDSFGSLDDGTIFWVIADEVWNNQE